MSKFEELVNKTMQDIVRQDDKFVLQNLTIENLFELQKMIVAEIDRRFEEHTKVLWKQARNFTKNNRK